MAFGFCFHVIFYSPTTDYAKNSNETLEVDENIELDEDEKKDERFGSFESLWIGFIKMLVMLTGEFEASDLNFHGWSGYALLLGFVLTSILIYNFINGLAIADVQKLREKGEFHDLKLKILTIQRHERYLGNFSDQDPWSLKKFLTRLIVSDPLNVTGGTVNEKRVVQFYSNVENDKTKKNEKPTESSNKIIPSVTLSKDSYDRLKDILKGKESNEESKNFEKKFDSLAFEFSQMKENLSETLNTNFEKNYDDVDSKLESFSQEFRDRNEIVNSDIQSLENKVDAIYRDMTEIKSLLKDWLGALDESEFAANERNTILQEKRRRFQRSNETDSPSIVAPP
jgi:hypothetical protein